MPRRMIWRAKRSAIRHDPTPAFEVEFDTSTEFTLDGEVPPQLEFLRGKDLRYHADVCKRARIVIEFVKFVYADVERR